MSELKPCPFCGGEDVVKVCDGAVYVRAASAKEAREFVCDMTTDKMYGKSDGTWDIDEAEEVDE